MTAAGARIDVGAPVATGRILVAGIVLACLTDAIARALLQTWGTAARRHPVGGLGSIGEMLIEHNHGFGQGRGSHSECSFKQAHTPHDTRSEEHTAALQSLNRPSYAVFSLNKN